MTTPNLSWLEDFLALAASGNFSRAAEERHMTQPAFSRRIRHLEEWLGTELFDRSGQPARLTAAGEWLRETAEEILARVARVPGEARAVAEADSSTLRFAATHALSFTFLPAWLCGLESRTAVGPVTLVSDVLSRCETLLAERQVQFVLAHAPAGAPGGLRDEAALHARVGDDELLPVAAPDADGRPRHAPADAGVRLLAYSAESGLGRILREQRGAALDRLGAQPVFTAHLASVLRSMALDGRGLAWLPRSLIADDLAAGRLVVAGDAGWRIALEVRLYRDARPLGRAGEAFWGAATA